MTIPGLALPLDAAPASGYPAAALALLFLALLLTRLRVRPRGRPRRAAGGTGGTGGTGRAGPDDGGRALHPDTRRLARGEPRIADFLAPAAVVVGPTWLRLDGGYARVLFIHGVPRDVGNGWLARLVGCEEPLEFAQHIRPLDSARMARDMGIKLNAYEASRRQDEQVGRIRDAEREVAMRDAGLVRERLATGETKLYAVGHYVLVRAPSLEALNDRTARLYATLGAIQLLARPADLQQDRAFRTVLPEGQDRVGAARTFAADSLAAAFPFDTGSLSSETGVFYGLTRQGLLLFDLFALGGRQGLVNHNLLVLATPGAGKSYFTKLLAVRHLEQGVEFFIIDPEDEYGRLCAALGGQYVRLALASDQAINPFDLPLPGDRRPGRDDRDGEPADPVAEQVDALIGLLGLMLATPRQPLTPAEEGLLDRALYATYAAAGIRPGEPDSWSRPAPLLGDLVRTLAGLPGERARSLAGRLHPYAGGRLAGLFTRPTNVDLDNRFVVFSLQRLDRRLQPLAIHVITQFIWGRIRRAPRKRLLVVDEAWLLLEHPAGAAFLAGTARRARKYRLGLVTITHKAQDLTASEHGQTLLATAQVKLLMKQNEGTIRAVVDTFGFTPAEERYLLHAKPGEGLFLVPGGRVPLQVLACTEEDELITTDPAQLEALAAAAAAEREATARPARSAGRGAVGYRPQAGGR